MIGFLIQMVLYDARTTGTNWVPNSVPYQRYNNFKGSADLTIRRFNEQRESEIPNSAIEVTPHLAEILTNINPAHVRLVVVTFHWIAIILPTFCCVGSLLDARKC